MTYRTDPLLEIAVGHDRPRCTDHGGYQTEIGSCQTHDVLVDVAAERARQFAEYGANEDLQMGMGPGVRWLREYTPHNARRVERDLRVDYEEHERVHGKPTWMHLIREEVAEAFAEGDPAKLRAELLQVAALAVSAVEKLDAKHAGLNFTAAAMARVTGSVGATVIEERVQPDGSVVEVARATYGEVN